MFQWYLLIAWVSCSSFPAGLRVLTFHVPTAMFSLPLIFLIFGTPVAYLSPTSRCLTVGAVIVIPGCDRSGIGVFFGFHLHGVSRAEFSLTEPIPLQAVYIDHSRNPRLLYGSPWSRTHGRWLKEFFRPGRWLLLGRLPPSGVVLSPPLIDPSGWETHGGGSVLFPPSKSLTCPLPII